MQKKTFDFVPKYKCTDMQMYKCTYSQTPPSPIPTPLFNIHKHKSMASSNPYE